ncbi:hypothetical protein PA1963 [Pseudomonas aeruginosa]|nr:hypothetical protein PA1963 [Pseudomonas aeruginosa]
MMAGYVD